MIEYFKMQVSIIKIYIAILLLLIGLSFLLSSDPMPMVLGFVFGGTIGILNFVLLGQILKKSVKMVPHKAQGYVSMNYFLRLTLIGFVIITALRADYLNAFCVIIGLLLIKPVIFCTQIFNNNKFFTKNKERKEGK